METFGKTKTEGTRSISCEEEKDNESSDGGPTGIEQHKDRN
jgi:hypothetical protein